MNFDTSKYKIYTWKHPLMIHWVLNPGLAINELILGQRVPKITLVEKNKEKSRFERNYIPCPYCKTIHDSRTWTPQNKTGFKNWFGLFCPTCEEVIPCLTNLTSGIILLISYPIRLLFIKGIKQKWLIHQKERYQNIDINKTRNPYDGWGWLYQGLIFGFMMLIFNNIFDFFSSNEAFNWRRLLISIPIWVIGGLGYGYVMKKYMANAKKMNETNF